jgi:hypothetical protein
MIGKTVRFISDCELFPNFDVTIKISSIYLNNNEIIFQGIVKNRKDFKIGSNMKNLRFIII